MGKFILTLIGITISCLCGILSRFFSIKKANRLTLSGRILFSGVVIGSFISIWGAYKQYLKSQEIQQAVIAWQIQIDADKVFDSKELSTIRANNKYSQPEVESLQPLLGELNDLAMRKLSNLMYNTQLFLCSRTELATLYKRIRPEMRTGAESLSTGPTVWLHYIHHTEFHYPQKTENAILVTLPPFVQEPNFSAETFPRIFFE